MKFIQTLVKCSLSPSDTSSEIYPSGLEISSLNPRSGVVAGILRFLISGWSQLKQCSYKTSEVLPPSTYIRCIRWPPIFAWITMGWSSPSSFSNAGNEISSEDIHFLLLSLVNTSGPTEFSRWEGSRSPCLNIEKTCGDWEGKELLDLFRYSSTIMADDDVNNNRVEQLKNSLKEFRETVQNSLQQITQTLATLTTHKNDEHRNPGGLRLSRGRRNDQPERQRIQPHEEDSDVEDEFEDGWNGGRRFGQRGAREFDYRQQAKDVPTFHGSINVEDFLD
ncbi:hypothetical protein Tco_0853535 [Tanacetum coccineum]